MTGAPRGRRKPDPERRSSTSWIRKSTRFAIYARDGFDCLMCYRVFPLAYDGAGLTLDHIVPRFIGGSDAPQNLVTACHRCNSERQHLELPARQRARLQALAVRPLNRELGRHYALLYRACRDQDVAHPLTGRKIVLPSRYDDMQEYLWGTNKAQAAE
jgi:hypothetical protein